MPLPSGSKGLPSTSCCCGCPPSQRPPQLESACKSSGRSHRVEKRKRGGFDSSMPSHNSAGTPIPRAETTAVESVAVRFFRSPGCARSPLRERRRRARQGIEERAQRDALDRHHLAELGQLSVGVTHHDIVGVGVERLVVAADLVQGSDACTAGSPVDHRAHTPARDPRATRTPEVTVGRKVHAAWSSTQER